jgi:hypothetical protein
MQQTVNYPHIRGISESVDARVRRKFEGEPTSGRAAPRQGWQKSQICISALDFEWASPVYTLWQCALHIASRRSEQELRDVRYVRARFVEECDEMDVLLEREHARIVLLNRLSNVLYYAVQIYAQDQDIEIFESQCRKYAQKAGLPVSIALQIAAAKYWDRAPRARKDVSSEERAMECAYQQFLRNVENR